MAWVWQAVREVEPSHPDWAEGTHWPNLSSQSAGHSEYGCAAWKTEGGGEAAVKFLFASNGLAQAAVPPCEPRLRAGRLAGVRAMPLRAGSKHHCTSTYTFTASTRPLRMYVNSNKRSTS